MVKNSSFLKCDEDSVIFTKKSYIKINFEHITIDIESKIKLKFIFKNRNTKQTLIQILKKLIHSTKNCSLNFFSFYKIENKKYSEIKIPDSFISLFNYNSGALSLFSTIVSNGILAYLLLICQIQEIFGYLFLIYFNGGTIFEYINSSGIEFF